MRIRRLQLQILVVTIAIIVATAASRAVASMIFVSEDGNGRELTLDRGDALEVSLPATSGTGYTWQAEPIPGGIVKQIGEPTFKSDSAKPGASGYQVFVFAPAANGAGVLELHYLRPWEKGKTPVKVFKIMLTVH